MFKRLSFHRLQSLVAPMVLASSVFASAQERAPIPEDLLADDHVREEFGVNMFTAPSIEKIFETLDALGDLPYEKLSRKLPSAPPKERAIAALSTGTLIADGFLSVQCEQRGDLEPIGRSLLDHAEALGTDKRMNRHTKGLLEHSLAGDWEKLKVELAATQSDVEAELVLLRDVNMANLIALGGWLRAFQIGSLALEESFDEEKAKTIMRTDVAEYFVGEAEYIEPDVLGEDKLKQLHADLVQLREQMDPNSEGKYTKAQISGLNEHVDALLLRLLAQSNESN